jgi:hypothetical protein
MDFAVNKTAVSLKIKTYTIRMDEKTLSERLFGTIKINRRLRDVRTTRFSHIFSNWRGKGKMIIKGDQVLFNDIFVNFGNVTAIRAIFGKRTKTVLSKLQVGVFDGPGYLWIDNKRGRSRLMASRKYILTGKRLYIYLDVVHELVHIRQHAAGTDLWNEKYAYLERPTEIEAYMAAAKEGMRLGMSAKELKRYLNAPWSSRKNNDEFYMKIVSALRARKMGRDK